MEQNELEGGVRVPTGRVSGHLMAI
jgi:hypothetical protein